MFDSHFTLQALLNLDGNSLNSQRIAVRYQKGDFAAAWMSAKPKLGEQMQLCPDDVQLTLTPPELVCVAQLLAGNKTVESLTVHSQPGAISKYLSMPVFPHCSVFGRLCNSLLKSVDSISCLHASRSSGCLLVDLLKDQALTSFVMQVIHQAT